MSRADAAGASQLAASQLLELNDDTLSVLFALLPPLDARARAWPPPVDGSAGSRRCPASGKSCASLASPYPLNYTLYNCAAAPLKIETKVVDAGVERKVRKKFRPSRATTHRTARNKSGSTPLIFVWRAAAAPLPPAAPPLLLLRFAPPQRSMHRFLSPHFPTWSRCNLLRLWMRTELHGRWC